MRFRSALSAVALTAAAVPAAAQTPRIITREPVNPERVFRLNDAGPRAVVGITTSSGATVRDTLGVLVSSVYQGSPAEKAGIEEGNRIIAVNGVSLKLAAADVGDDQMAGIMSRRLTREVERLHPGDDVDLRVFSTGQIKSVKVKTVDASDLYRTTVSRRLDERPTLGVNLAATGSIRDTLGVFVMSVDDGGPAAKAGIEEGSRIASINGVDVRSRRSEDEDGFMRSSNLNRLQREISRLKPGDDVELRVYTAGQVRTVHAKVMSWSDLPRHNRAVTIIGGDHPWPPMDDFHVSIDGAEIGDNVRRIVERAMDGAGHGLETLGLALGDIGRGFGRTRVVW